MVINPNLICPCGNYCGVCGVFIATRYNNDKFKEALVGVFKGTLSGGENLRMKEIHCEGCLSEQLFYYGKRCPSGNAQNPGDTRDVISAMISLASSSKNSP